MNHEIQYYSRLCKSELMHSVISYLTNIFTVNLRDWQLVGYVVGWFGIYLELSPPKTMDQSKNVTLMTFHIWPGIVHEHIFLALGGARGDI